MKVDFTSAKNGELTCSIEGKFLCSAYNPSREAESFVNSIAAEIKPSIIFIIEPALSYINTFLKNRFPETKFCAIRLLDDFKDFDQLWDNVLYFNKTSDFSDLLYQSFTEEELCSSLFLEWRPACQFFQDELKSIWKDIKQTLSKSRDVLVTKSFFSARWLTNTINFLSNVNKTYKLHHTDKPVLIAASGPAIFSSIPKIIENRSKFTLIAVSSALSIMNYYKIKPDLVLSTDGGYWAAKHLDFPGIDKSDLTYAIPPEAMVSKNILQNSGLIPLTYNDGFENLFKINKLNFYNAERNGTVSGTALELALTLTDKEIFLCGVDLCSAKGYQHTSPNELELINSTKDFRLKTKYTRLASSEFSDSQSLNIYLNWFKSFSYKTSRKIYRISDNYQYSNNLGNIKDVNWSFFENFNYKNDGSTSITTAQTIKGTIDFNELLNIITTLEKSDFIDQLLFPLETSVKNHSTRPEEINKIQTNIKTKRSKLIKKLYSLVQKP